MLDFKEPKITDKPWVDQCLSHAHSMNCEYTFGNIFVWRTAYVTCICHYKDFLLIRYGRGADIAYSPPVGTGDFADAVDGDAVILLWGSAEAQGVDLVKHTIFRPHKHLPFFSRGNKLYPF